MIDESTRLRSDCSLADFVGVFAWVYLHACMEIVIHGFSDMVFRAGLQED